MVEANINDGPGLTSLKNLRSLEGTMEMNANGAIVGELSDTDLAEAGNEGECDFDDNALPSQTLEDKFQVMERLHH